MSVELLDRILEAVQVGETTEGLVSNVRLQELLTDHSVDITRMLTRLCEQGLLVSDNRRRWTTYRLSGGPQGPSLFGVDDSSHLAGDSRQLPERSGHLPEDSRHLVANQEEDIG